jgi:hypothetical protein
MEQEIDETQQFEEDGHLFYYQGRVLRVNKWKKLYKHVLQVLQKHTVLLFLQWFYFYLVEYLQVDSGRNLLGKVCIFLYIVASYYWVDCGVLYLIWLIKYYLQSEFQEIWNSSFFNWKNSLFHDY